MSDEFPKEKILLWGMGVSGKAVKELLDKQGLPSYCIDKEDGHDFTEETLPYKDLLISRVIKSPGISWDHPAFEYFKQEKIPVMGEIEWVWRFSQVPVIAVTGSNGKSTTVNMISHALKLFHTDHFLGGNWGIPYSRILLDSKYEDSEFAVLELSSFQLELIQDFKPDVSMILNISPNHMERYSSFEAYEKAKRNIYKNEPQFHFEFNEDDYRNFLSKFQFKNMKVQGEHNKRNFYFCYKALEAIRYEDDFQDVIDSYPGIPHRIEFCGEKKGVKIYNDSKSTNLESTLTAIRSFDKNIHLILGGKLRGVDVSPYSEILKFSQIKSISLFGEAAFFLKDVFPHAAVYDDLKSLLNNIKTQPGDNVLFSPGFPSFDQFKNFEDRGEQFKRILF